MSFSEEDSRGRVFLVTGGAGFIGSAVVRLILQKGVGRVAVVDKLTYAGRMENLSAVSADPNFTFYHEDICHGDALKEIFASVRPTNVLHLAAESHVDNSILAPAEFIRTNIDGTYTMLEVARNYYCTLTPDEQIHFRFQHISTDEVYGDLISTDATPFCETSPYQPSSPYSASKAAADHLVRAWHRTYGLPTIITNCSNNYGPYQHPEKLIPRVISAAMAGTAIGVYGDGLQRRDWLHVDDHAEALLTVALRASAGSCYAIGGGCECTNMELVNKICRILDELRPRATSYATLITHVSDRPGHDRRYAINADKIQRELGWSPAQTLDSGLRQTIQWYLDHQEWCR